MKKKNWIRNFWDWIFKKKVVEKEEGHMMMDFANEFNKMTQPQPIIFPQVRRHFYEDPDIILYSYYFKRLGASQGLDYGDWYGIKDKESNRILCKVYHKNEVESIEDFEFMANTEYVRLISQDEAFSIMNDLGYIYNMESIDPAIGMTPDGRWYVDMYNPQHGLNFKVDGFNLHAAHLKAAYTIFLYAKQTQDFIIDLNNNGFLTDPIEELGEEDEDEDDAGEEWKQK